MRQGDQAVLGDLRQFAERIGDDDEQRQQIDEREHDEEGVDRRSGRRHSGGLRGARGASKRASKVGVSHGPRLAARAPDHPQRIGNEHDRERRQHHDRGGRADGDLAALEHEVVDIVGRKGRRDARPAIGQRDDEIEGLDRELQQHDRDRDEDRRDRRQDHLAIDAKAAAPSICAALTRSGSTERKPARNSAMAKPEDCQTPVAMMA